MSITARTIITDALKLAGILASGETLNANDASDGLRMLNNLIDGWNSEGLYTFAVSDVSATFSGASATIGTSMVVNTSRPTKIKSAFYRSGGIDYQLRVIDADEYYSIIDKTTSGNPEVIYYESTAPTGTVRVYPVPGSTEYHLQVEAQLTEFANLDTAYDLPQGYKRALTYTMAEEEAPIFGQVIAPSISLAARNMRRVIKRSNSKVPVMTVLVPGNSAESPRINILTNQ